MNKILHFLFILTLLTCYAKSVEATELIATQLDSNELFETVILTAPQIENDGFNEEEKQITEENLTTDISAEEQTTVQAAEIYENSSLKERLKKVYKLDVERYDHPEYLLRESLTHNCKPESKMERLHLWGAINGFADFGLYSDGDFRTKYRSNALNIGLDGFLKDNNGDFRIMLGFPIETDKNYVHTLFSDVYIATNKIPHHRIQFGHFRPQIGMEGGNSAYTLGFLGRSQIARNFGTARRVGGRIKGDYSFIDYDFGLYSSDTFFDEFFPGAEFVSWINIKPLAKVEHKYGHLKIGGGIDAGHRHDNFFVTGAYIGYNYKRFMAEFEWANANGYNGYYGFSRKHATGFYATVGYMITKKLQVLACFDQFTPDKTVANNKQREMTLGLNYFIKGQALRLILNYVFCQNDATKDSHRIMLGAQILI